MKVQYLGLLIGALALAGSMPAQTINNGQEVAGLFKMDITIPTGSGWFLQRTSVLVPSTWATIAGPYSSGPTFAFTDPASGPATQSYYRLVKVPTLGSADCGVNRYGFIRKTVTVGFCMYADQLLGDSGNSLANIMPVMNHGTYFYQYSGGYTIDDWDIANPGWSSGTSTLNPGQGCFLLNPGPVNPVTFIGTVPEGTLTTPIVSGYNMVSSQVPQAGLLTSDLGFPAQDQDTVYQFVCGQGYVIYVYDLSGVGGWDPYEPLIDVGESFFVLSNGPHAPWVRSFSACP